MKLKVSEFKQGPGGKVKLMEAHPKLGYGRVRAELRVKHRPGPAD